MITIFQHGTGESGGEIESFLEDTGVPGTVVRLYETNEIPPVTPEHLIVLGGQMSVNDTGEYPYFIREKETIRKMVGLERPVLGICLGAQMIASAFGERVFPSPMERGWCQVSVTPDGGNFPFQTPHAVFHWHKETFNLPGKATLLLTGENVKNQAFRLGSAVGVQFHPEVTMEIISRWAEELNPGERRRLLDDSEHQIGGSKEQCRILMRKFLHGWET
jgi:GMP synthase (glutamine-hydrolysing)